MHAYRHAKNEKEKKEYRKKDLSVKNRKKTEADKIVTKFEIIA